MTLIGEMSWGTLADKTHEQYSDFRVTINELMVEIGETEGQLNIFDFPGFRLILDDLERPSGDSIYLRYSQEITWNSHLSAWAKSLLVWSLWSTSQTWALCSE